jgi:hypothetical protein
VIHNHVADVVVLDEPEQIGDLQLAAERRAIALGHRYEPAAHQAPAGQAELQHIVEGPVGRGIRHPPAPASG